MNVLLSVFLAAANVTPDGTITNVAYQNGTCYVYVQGEDESRKVASTPEECATMKGLIGLNVDMITEHLS